MNCTMALEALLDEDPTALAVGEESPLGVHIRECGRCRRVAQQLMRDTHSMSLAMVHVRSSCPAPHARFAVVPAFGLAVLVLAAVLSSRPETAIPPSAVATSPIPTAM